MEWLKTFERVKEIQQQLIWPTVSEIESKAFIPEVRLTESELEYCKSGHISRLQTLVFADTMSKKVPNW